MSTTAAAEPTVEEYQLTPDQLAAFKEAFEVERRNCRVPAGTPSAFACLIVIDLSYNLGAARSINKSIFDKQKLGIINYAELPALLRSVGQNPTETDIEAIVEEWDPNSTKHFDLDTFLRICESDSFKDPMKEEILMEAFRAFDPDGRGVLKVEVLRRMLQVLGERLEGEAADNFIDFALSKCDPDKTGEINYEVLTQELLDRDPKVAYA
ncbi:hypothetical protein FOL47_011113 [Perkinsus chesapeaki]|uniref:Calmodulin n=1 Tax=Perkinsus chesapeaki TaxID=330153 RepID=A0A7J6MPW9_PERCH|nr:hypothetical protein FOL47_011113 [Perkinsus chesapeaki]